MFFRRRDDPYRLVIGMTGVQLGDRVLQIGCAHGGRLAAIAARVGLSGRAVVIVSDEESAARARKGAEQAGVLVEVVTAPPGQLPVEDASFDLALIDDAGGFFGSMRAEDRIATVRAALRVLRPGGRVMVVASAPRAGLGGLLSRSQSGPPFDPVPALQADGFRSARMLAEREGLVFSEGIKPREATNVGGAI
jgi:ubiquinone/menaquinone biosynthesis C-methylase UbiE